MPDTDAPATGSGRAREPRRPAFHFWLLLPAAAAAGLRFWGIGDESLWEDEAASLLYTQLPLGTLLGSCVDPGNPPLYRVLLKGWIALFGDAEAGVRSLSACFGVAAVYAVGLLGRAFSGSACAGWAAAMLLALAPQHVFFSQETRAYALSGLLGLLSTLCLLRLLRRPNTANGAVYAVLAAMAPYVHFQGFVLLAGQLAGALLWTLMPPRARPSWRAAAWLLAAAALTAPCVALYVRPGLLTPGGYSYWQGAPTWHGVATMLVEWTLGHPAARRVPAELSGGQIAMLLAAIALPGVIAWLASRGARREWMLYIGVLYGAMAAFVVLTMWKPVWQPKYLNLLQPLYLVGVAWSVRAAAIGLRSRAVVAERAGALALVGAAVVWLAPALREQRARPWRPDYRGAMAAIAARDPSGAAPIFVYRTSYLAVGYYETGRRSRAEFCEIPSGNPGEGEVLRRLAAHRNPRVVEFRDAGSLPELVSGAVRGHDRAFVVVSESQAGSSWRDVLLGDAGDRRLISETWRVHVALVGR
ncbi:MAG: glycosyltransferase family 39 protein [Phycisphaerae bacterium]|jgi:hypothetical protein|nr:glycosyltransferase family 39 protein [Phycisphaerae bacterium]MCZ2398420.1 glycosyltransferase family 39 protein [Phycisphaerae bacterium]